MLYRVTLEGQEREIDVQVTPGGAVTVTVDGQPAADADVLPVPGGVNVRLGGRVFDVMVGGKPEELTVAAGPLRVVAVVESDRTRARRRARKGGSSSGKELRAPMPGRIVKVLVGAGDEVQADQPLVVIEAMKMENELRADGPRSVASVAVREGQAVEGGALLLTFA